MTVAATVLASGADAIDRQVYPSASLTPAANRPTLVLAVARVTSGTPPTPTCSGGGITWGTAVINQPFTDTRLALFAFLGSTGSPSTGTIDLDFGSTIHCCNLAVVELPMADPSGTVVQVKSGTAASGEPALTFDSAFGSAANATLFVTGQIHGLHMSPDAGWTELLDEFATPPLLRSRGLLPGGQRHDAVRHLGQ